MTGAVLIHNTLAIAEDSSKLEGGALVPAVVPNQSERGISPKMSKNRSEQFIGGLLLGTVIGGVTGILMAPRSGRQTRQLLKKSAQALPELAEDISTNVQIQADRLSDATLRNLEETLERLQQAIAVAIEAGAREQEALSNQLDSDPEDPKADISEQLPSDSPSDLLFSQQQERSL